MYGYGKYGRFAVYLLDESGTNYEQIVDACAEQITDHNHKICSSQDINPNIDCALVTPQMAFHEISNVLRERDSGDY